MDQLVVRYILESANSSRSEVRYPLTDGDHIIGRHSQSDLCLGVDGRVVSKKHAVLRVRQDTVVIRDCGSTNGTFVNEQAVSESALKDGDIIGLGENGPRLRLVRNTEIGTVSGSQTLDGAGQKAGMHTGNGRLVSGGPVDRPAASSHRESLNPKSETDTDVPGSGGSQPSVHKAPVTLTGLENIGIPLISSSGDESKDSGKKRAFTTREVERIIAGDLEGGENNRGALSKSQEVLFSKVAKVYRKKRRTMYVITGGIIVALLCIAVYYARGYYRYGKIISFGRTLKNDMRLIDRQYERLRQSDTVFSESRQVLLERLNQRERQLDSIMELLPMRYRNRMYSDSVERYLCEIMAELHEHQYRVPPHVLDLVKSYVTKFATKEKDKTQRLMGRKEKFFPYIEKTFRSEHIPVVLAYIAMQESALNPSAKSKAGATGLWQFMEETGMRYGLRSDERYDWRKATHAAARHLHDLLAVFGDGRGTLLAIAAYNTGEGNMRKALRAIKDFQTDRDFWYLYRTSDDLVEETREYVPQILARIIIDRHREYYGLRPQTAGSDE
jgi:hypothetical protein